MVLSMRGLSMNKFLRTTSSWFSFSLVFSGFLVGFPFCFPLVLSMNKFLLSPRFLLVFSLAPVRAGWFLGS